MKMTLIKKILTIHQYFIIGVRRIRLAGRWRVREWRKWTKILTRGSR